MGGCAFISGDAYATKLFQFLRHSHNDDIWSRVEGLECANLSDDCRQKAANSRLKIGVTFNEDYVCRFEWAPPYLVRNDFDLERIGCVQARERWVQDGIDFLRLLNWLRESLQKRNRPVYRVRGSDDANPNCSSSTSVSLAVWAVGGEPCAGVNTRSPASKKKVRLCQVRATEGCGGRCEQRGDGRRLKNRTGIVCSRDAPSSTRTRRW